jgi:hypothetical protein
MVRLRWDLRARDEFEEACRQAREAGRETVASALKGEVAAALRLIKPRAYRGIKRANHPRIEVVSIWVEEPWSLLYATTGDHRILLHLVRTWPMDLPEKAYELAENRLDHLRLG